jgi:hypothetical protein
MVDPDLLRTLSSGVFALLGTALGVIGSLGIQRRAARLEREKLSHAVRGRVNALSVTVFREFLAACKEVERLGERREAGDKLDGEHVRGRTSAMWLRWEEVVVFCDSAVEQPSRQFVNAVQRVAWHTPEGESVTGYVSRRRRDLFQVAGPIFKELTPEGGGR